MTMCRFAAVVLLAGALAAGRAPAAEVDRCLFEDTEAVLTVNVKQLLHAPLVKKHAAKALEQACREPALRRLLDGLGLDPLKDIDRVTLAWSGPDGKHGVLICRGRFDTAKFHAHLRKTAKENGDRLKAHKVGDCKYYEVIAPGQHGSLLIGSGVNSEGAPTFAWKQTGSLLDAVGTAYLTLADKNTLLVAPSKEDLVAACAGATAYERPRLGAAMRELLADLDGKQTVWFAACGGLLRKGQAGDGGAGEEQEAPAGAVESVSGGLTVGDGLQLRCALTASDADGARELMKTLDDLRTRAAGLAVVLVGNQKQYAFLKDVPRAFVATRKGATVLMEGHLSAELLDKFATLPKTGK